MANIPGYVESAPVPEYEHSGFNKLDANDQKKLIELFDNSIACGLVQVFLLSKYPLSTIISCAPNTSCIHLINLIHNNSCNIVW